MGTVLAGAVGVDFDGDNTEVIRLVLGEFDNLAL
jgi:hypothetical protein